MIQFRNAFKARLKPIGSWVNDRLCLMRDASAVKEFDFGLGSVRETKELMLRYATARPRIRTINWLVPYVKHPLFAGVYTVLRFADYFSHEKAIQNRIVIYNRASANLAALRGKIGAAFPSLADSVCGLSGSGLGDLLPSDITIATCWQSAYLLLQVKNTAAKFYFVQDFEPSFYPAGATYGLVEATYRLGYWGIANTEGLGAFLRSSYDMKVQSFRPAVDPKVFYPEPNRLSTPVKIFFYGRPENPRNGFMLGIEALKKSKEQFKDLIQIVSAGGDWNPADFGARGVVENLGLLPSIQDVAALYRRCHIGLVFMFTKHPSYQPIEMMASGVAVVTNVNVATKWFLRDGTNSLLVEPSVTSIAEAIGRLVSDTQYRNRLASDGLRTVGQTCWAAEIEGVYRFLAGDVGASVDEKNAPSVHDQYLQENREKSLKCNG
jgi:glycosyltransferase involved in cell wall biosynthesis